MCVDKFGSQLKSAIESVLNQEDGEFLFYIIANNCDDDLWEFLRQFQDPRIRLHRTLVGQLAFNLNYGLNLIRDGYALRMDADDVSLPGRLTVTRAALQQLNYPDVLAGAAILVDLEGRELGQVTPPLENSAIREQLWLSCPLVHPACAINVRAVLALRGYLGGFMSEDYDLWLRAARNPSFRFAGISNPVLQYRVGGDQARGHKLGYAEASAHLLREGLMGYGVKYFFGCLIGIMKRYLRASKG